MRRVLNEKIAKVPKYRRNVRAGAEMWLLIHSDGWPMSAHIANNRILERLLREAHSILHESSRFDRAYWLDDAYVRPPGG